MRSHVPTPWTDAQRAHLVLRLTLGANILVHGLVRIAHPGAFADATVRDFAQTPLPEWLVHLFALTVPPAELLIGLGVLLGLWLRSAVMLGGLLIAALMFGTCLRQAWEIAGIQLIYALAYYILAIRASDARLGLDGLLTAPSGRDMG